MTRFARRFLTVGVAAVGVLLWGGGATSTRADVGTEVEKIIGRYVAQALRDTSGVDDDPLLSRWVEGIGAKVSAPSPRRDVPYNFQILGTDTTNALAAPGGHIFVTRGLLDTIESDDELATILAHESAHVAKRHALQQIEANVLFYVLLSLLRDNKYGTVRTGATVANVLRTLEKSREMEAQADEVGIGLAWAGGYDPNGLVHFFSGIEHGEPSRLETYFATHPSAESRIRAASKRDEITRPTPALRETLARGYAARGLPGAAATARAGGDPLVLPPLAPLPPLPDYLAAEREGVQTQSAALRKSLETTYKAQKVGNIAKQILLINNQGDPRWLFLAARAYAVQARVDDIYARTLRVAQVAPGTWDALARYSVEAHGAGDPLALEGVVGRGEVKQSLDAIAGVPTPVGRAARAVATVLVDLNDRFFQPKTSAAQWGRYALLEGLVQYAETELGRADKQSGRAWRLLSLARVRRYQNRLTELVPENDPARRALWFDLAQRRFGAAFPDRGRAGDATVRAALAVELGQSAGEVETGRGTTPWADWTLKRKGTPENIATAIRLLTLDLEREAVEHRR